MSPKRKIAYLGEQRTSPKREMRRPENTFRVSTAYEKVPRVLLKPNIRRVDGSRCFARLGSREVTERVDATNAIDGRCVPRPNKKLPRQTVASGSCNGSWKFCAAQATGSLFAKPSRRASSSVYDDHISWPEIEKTYLLRA